MKRSRNIYLGKPPKEEILMQNRDLNIYLEFVIGNNLQIRNWRFYSTLDDIEIFFKTQDEIAKIKWTKDPGISVDFHKNPLFDVPLLGTIETCEI